MRLMMKILSLFLLVLLSSGAFASGFDHCFEEAGARYGVSPELLRAIAHVESGMNPLAHNPGNKNGSEDIGLMQINSRWLPELGKYGIRRSDLWEPCTSIHVGAWVLAGNIRRLGNTWQAIGAYNAKSKKKRIDYANRVYRHLSCESGGLRC